MIPYDLHSLSPAALYLVPLSLLWGLLFWRLSDWREGQLSEAGFAALVNRSKLLFGTQAAALSLAWLAAAIALTQPVGDGHYAENSLPKPVSKSTPLRLKRKAHDLILLIDASASMAVRDARQGKSRLSEAQEIAGEIIRNLNGQDLSLWAFTSLPSELAPPTLDYLFVRFMLAQMNINEGGAAGTDLYAALTQIQRKFFSAPSNRLKTLVILSDGGDTHFEELSGEKRNQSLASFTELFSDAKSQKLRVCTIGLGSEKGGDIPEISDGGLPVHSRLESLLLKKIAEAGRGDYFPAGASTPIQIAEEIQGLWKQDSLYIDKTDEAEEQLRQNLSKGQLIYRHYFQIPLGIALLLLAGVFFSPDSQLRREVV